MSWAGFVAINAALLNNAAKGSIFPYPLSSLAIIDAVRVGTIFALSTTQRIRRLPPWRKLPSHSLRSIVLYEPIRLALLWQIFCVHGIPKSLFL